jgi:hypothetical protein
VTVAVDIDSDSGTVVVKVAFAYVAALCYTRENISILLRYSWKQPSQLVIQLVYFSTGFCPQLEQISIPRPQGSSMQLNTIHRIQANPRHCHPHAACSYKQRRRNSSVMTDQNGKNISSEFGPKQTPPSANKKNGPIHQNEPKKNGARPRCCRLLRQ